MKELKEVFDIFKKEDLPLWLHWGSLLGAYRDGEFFDDDTDLATTNLNTPYYKAKYDKIVKYLNSKGYVTEKRKYDLIVKKNGFSAGIGFYEINKETESLFKRTFILFQDEYFSRKFFYKFIRDNPTNFKYSYFQMLGARLAMTVYPLKMICPLRKFKFKGIDLYIPNNPEQTLEYLYGPNWEKRDPTFPHYVTDENINYWKGTFTKFYVNCPKCNAKFLEHRHDFNRVVKSVKIKCPYCKKKFKQKVSIKGTLLRNVDEIKVWRTL